MKRSLLLLLFFFPFIANALQVDSAHSASIYIYYPAEGARGTFKIYMDDSLVWSAKYNSRKEVKIYKEGKTVFWTPPQKQYSVLVDVKFGEVYFLQCSLTKGELILMPVLKQVSAFSGRQAYDQIQRDSDSLQVRRERREEQRRLDTVLRRNTIYADWFGQSVFYSLNYDRLIRVNKKVKRSFSIGLGFWPSEWISVMASVPISYNFVFGNKNGHLELGFGLTMFTKEEYRNTYIDVYDNHYDYSYVVRRDYNLLIFSKIGYRYQKVRGGIFFRAYFSPMANFLHIARPIKFKERPEFNIPASYSVFYPIFYDPDLRVVPWAGVSFGYSFNFKKTR